MLISISATGSPCSCLLVQRGPGHWAPTQINSTLWELIGWFNYIFNYIIYGYTGCMCKI